MANDWIKFRTKLITDGRVAFVSDQCHASTVTVIGALVTLWCLGDQHADANGVLFGYTFERINKIVDIPGFCDFLPGDWIDRADGWVKLPNYQEHNGTTAKGRAQATSRKRHERERTVVQDQSRNGRDKNVTREEKRREEKKDQKQSSLRSDSSTASPPTGTGDALAGQVLSSSEKHAKLEARLTQITRDAMAAYNATLAKPNGHCRKVTEIGFEKKRLLVKRCLKIASEICEVQYGGPQITAKFWSDYFQTISRDEFKSGRAGGGKGHEGWIPNFAYLTRPDVMIDVFDQASTDVGEAA